jgi:predicted DNA-binding transcriptional regulator AlpA
LSKSSINAWVASGRFPKPTNLSLTIKVWRYKDVADWIDEALERGDKQ